MRTDGSRLETNCIFQTFIYKNILVCKVYCQNKGSIRMALEQASMYSDNSWEEAKFNQATEQYGLTISVCIKVLTHFISLVVSKTVTN